MGALVCFVVPGALARCILGVWRSVNVRGTGCISSESAAAAVGFAGDLFIF